MKKPILIAAVLLLGAAGPRQDDVPAAVLVRVEGTVQVQTGEADPRPGSVGTRLSAGDRVLPAEGGRAVIVYRSGLTRQVTEALTIEAPSGGREADVFSRTVRVLAQAATSDARSQPNRQGMIRPVQGSPELVAPRNGITVMDPRPTFRWLGVEGAPGYVIQIRREGGPPLRFRTGPETSWTLPEDAPALVPGATYHWTVASAARGRPAREQTFRVIGPETYGTLAREMEALVASGLDPAGDGAFLAAVLYREAGLLYEAAGALGLLESSGTPLSPEVYLLKGEIMDALGDLEAARAAFDRADEMMR